MLESSLYSKFASFFTSYPLYTYRKRSMILQSHDSLESVFFIKSGYIRVFRISEEGQELTLVILKPNDSFPLTYDSKTVTHNYYLEALTTVEIWKAPLDLFITYVKEDPALFEEMTNTILIRFNSVLARLESMAFRNAYSKVASTILMCAQGLGKKEGNSVTVNVPLTHRDIATMIGLTRETTSLEMKKLERKGILKKHGNLLIINNYEELEEEALQNIPNGSLTPRNS